MNAKEWGEGRGEALKRERERITTRPSERHCWYIHLVTYPTRRDKKTILQTLHSTVLIITYSSKGPFTLWLAWTCKLLIKKHFDAPSWGSREKLAWKWWWRYCSTLTSRPHHVCCESSSCCCSYCSTVHTCTVCRFSACALEALFDELPGPGGPKQPQELAEHGAAQAAQEVLHELPRHSQVLRYYNSSNNINDSNSRSRNSNDKATTAETTKNSTVVCNKRK